MVLKVDVQNGLKVDSHVLEQAHYCLSSIRDKTCSGSEYSGWFDYPKHTGLEEVQGIQKQLKDFPLHYDSVIVLGIGGSHMGVRAIDEALNHTYAEKLGFSNRLPIYYAGHHLSEREYCELFDVLPTLNPLVVAVSKSGKTIETGVAFRVMYEYLMKRYGGSEAHQRLFLVTDPNSGFLRDFAEQNSVSAHPIPHDVGGRYSIFTAVGTLPLALAQFNVEELLAGADAYYKKALQDEDTIQFAAQRYLAWQSGKTIDVLAYGDPKLLSLSRWWQQLFGESEGKDGKGLFPSTLCYSTDLHSMGQYLQDGPANILETFLSVKSPMHQNGTQVERRLRIPVHSQFKDGLDGVSGGYIEDLNSQAMAAAEYAHHNRGLPCLKLTLPSIGEYELGYFMAFMQTVCAVSGLLLGVNPFNQPGVEAYKDRLREIGGF